MATKIDIISRELIKPASPTPPHSKELKLSLLDQHAPFQFIPLIFFYERKKLADHPTPTVLDHEDPSKTSLHLKQSLSETLTKFYPLAGKLNPPDLSSVDCDDSGALFVEAKVDAPLSEAVRNVPFENIVQYLPFEPYAAPNGGGTAVLADNLLLGTYPRNEILLGVKISWFECGGSAIGVCISHKVADFASLVTFMNSWSAANRVDQLQCAKTLIKTPNFDVGRHLFPPNDFPNSGVSAATEEKGKIVFKRFVFNKEKLTQLKELATYTNSSSLSKSSLVKDPTRVEVVTAFLWRQFIKMARAKRNDHYAKSTTTAREFRIWHVVNLRSRMSSLCNDDDESLFPFGNLISATPVSFSGTCDDDDDDDDDLVWLISDAIRRVNDDFVLIYCAVLNLMMKSSGTSSTSTSTSGISTTDQSMGIMRSDWVFSSWCRFPTYEVDFGWGKPVSVGPAAAPNRPLVLLTSTGADEEGIEAWIAMFADEIEFLPEDILSLAATDYFDVNSP